MELKKSDKKSVLPFLEGLAFPMMMINNHLRDFLKLIGVAAGITSLITILVGRSNYCSLYQGLSNTVFCPFASISVFFIPLVFLFILFFSGWIYNRWQLIFSENRDFSMVIKEKMLKKNLKTSIFLFIYILFWCIVGLCLLVLEKRIPNPDWRMELLFFVGLSMSILLMVVLLFNFVIFQHALNGGSLLAIKKTFMPIFDNIYKLMFWFIIYFLIFLYLLRAVVVVFSDKSFPIWVNVLFGELAFYTVLYSMIAVFSAALFYQEKQIFSEKE